MSKAVDVPKPMSPGLDELVHAAWLTRPAAMKISATPVQRKKRRQVEDPRAAVEAVAQERRR